MKPSIRFYSRFSVIALAGMALALGACQAGTVGVTSVSPPSARHLAQAQSAELAPLSEAGTIYFSRIRVTDGEAPTQIIGLGFLPESAETPDSFGKHFKPVEFSPFATLVALNDGALYLGGASVSSGGERQSLNRLVIGSLDSRALFDVRSPTSLAASPDGQSVVWTESDGAAYLKDGARPRECLNLSGGHAKRAFYGGGLPAQGGEVLVALAHSTRIFASGSAPEEIPGSLVAASPTRMRLLVATAGGYGVYDRASHRLQELAPFKGLELREPLWTNESAFVFWRKLGDQAALYSYELASAKTELVSELGFVPPSDGIVCPAWRRGKLYFADQTDGTIEIHRAARASAPDGVAAATAASPTWSTSLFARAQESDWGLICPQAVFAE